LGAPAAARLADLRLEDTRRGSGIATVLLVLLGLFCLLGVAADSPWWAVGAAICTGGLVGLVGMAAAHRTPPGRAAGR